MRCLAQARSSERRLRTQGGLAFAATILALSIGPGSPVSASIARDGRAFFGQVRGQPESRVRVDLSRDGKHITLMFRKVNLFCDEGGRGRAAIGPITTRVKRDGRFEWDKWALAKSKGPVATTEETFKWIRGTVDESGSVRGFVLAYYNPYSLSPEAGPECSTAGKRNWRAE